MSIVEASTTIEESTPNQQASSYTPQVKNQFIPSIGHPLQTDWAFWYFQRQAAGQTHNGADSH